MTIIARGPMLFSDRAALVRPVEFVSVAIATVMVAAIASPLARAESFDGPTFRQGLWRFDRTVEYPNHRLVVRQEETTRCVDPTHAMKGTFSSPDIGKCRSTRPERVDNRYTFENRCDYLGPVRTAITVHSEEGYTELNTPNFGNFPQVDKIVARRIGDCDTSQ